MIFDKVYVLTAGCILQVMKDVAARKFFTKALVQWHANENTRSLPWKEEKDPYKIWLSEVILQQTRAAQGLPYYLKFTEALPTIEHMAAADDEDVFRLWQGLGYYNRCKNMLATARLITNELKGRFPDTHEGLLALKGVGPYTAAAIGSFAFGLPLAVVDGNVYRVLSRYFGIETPFDTTEGKKQFSQLAQELLDTSDSAGYNQAIMDLGATVCTPSNPLCNECPLQKHCAAFRQGLIDVLPVRSKKQKVRSRFFHYIILIADDKIWIHKRGNGDIWENLHEFLLIEKGHEADASELCKEDMLKPLKLKKAQLEYAGYISQRLTHQLITTRFFIAQLPKPENIPVEGGKWINKSDLKKIAFPKTLVSFLEKNLYF